MRPSWSSSRERCRCARTVDMTPRVALTSGEPAGIGPELCLALASEELPCELVCLADRALLSERATRLNLAVTLRSSAHRAGAAGPAPPAGRPRGRDHPPPAPTG